MYLDVEKFSKNKTWVHKIRLIGNDAKLKLQKKQKSFNSFYFNVA